MKSSFCKQQMSVAATVAAILSGVVMVGYSPVSHSQEAAPKDELGEISEVTVTGSRILRKDLTSNSPLVTVDTGALEQRSGLNIESYLNQLPAFNPASAPTILNGPGSNSDVQISAVSSVGISAISLRGLGSNRTLTLIDGRRAVPVNALMTVDTNGIPSSMIKRVEIISGGASAVYGADAIGGVSNFILRRDFEGLEIDTQYGTAEAGDNQEIRGSAIAGTRIADGKGHIVFAAEYYDRQAAFLKNRDFFTDAWKDPTVPGNFLSFVFGANGYNTQSTPPSQALLGNMIGRPLVSDGNPLTNTPEERRSWSYANPGTGSSASIRFNPNGSLFLPAGPNLNQWGYPIDDRTYSIVNALDTRFANGQAIPPDTIQQVKYNETEGYASSPQTRYSFMASTDYEITDHIKFFSDARFSQSKTQTFLAGTNASLGWEVTVPYNAATDSPVRTNFTAADYANAALMADVMANPQNYANAGYRAHGTAGAAHPVPVNMALLLNSRARIPPANAAFDPLTSPWVLETYPSNSFGRRATIDEVSTWQIETGFRFDIPVKDWTGEVYYSRGESSTYNVAQGNNSLARWREMVQTADYGRGASLNANDNHLNNPKSPGSVNPGFGTVNVHCTTGFYETIFNGDARPSDDCIYAVSAALQTRTENQQDVVELNFQGGLFNLPAGELRAAAGYQSRRNSAQFNPDILQSTASFRDQAIGVYPTGYLDAESSVNDFYGELLIPVIGGFKWLKNFELDIGGRQSDYKNTSDTFTFKVNANVEINDKLRLRGGFNRATRAPNLGEMYLNLQQVFGAGGAYGDPCGVFSNSPYGAGGALATNPYDPSPTAPKPGTAGGQTAAGAQSTYLICRAQMGEPAANFFYGANNPLPPAGSPAPGGFAWNNQMGNPDLDSETADTWTAGFVVQSPWENAGLRGLSATVDWYKISMEDVIEPYSVDYARYLCYGTTTVTNAAEAAAQAASEACQNVPRNTGLTGGGALTQLLKYANQATVATSGIDFAVNWFANLNDLGVPKIPGGIGLNVQGTWLDYYRTKLSPTNFDPVIDWKGSLGPNVPGFNGGAYAYRLFSSLSYNLPTVNFSLRWRYLPRVDQYAKAQENAIKANNARVANGGDGIILSYTPTTLQATPSYSTFDFSMNWNVTDKYSIRAGVDNLFDKDPEIAGNTSKQTGYPDSLSVCNGEPGCQNPTIYSLPNSGQGQTSGGFYDTLGRRYYVGIKAQF
jgi:outer membrane receptor protein involved in Fe transport